LLVWVEVEAGAAVVVVAQYDLLAGLVFRGYVVCGVGFDAVFAAPDEGGFEAGGCVGEVPF